MSDEIPMRQVSGGYVREEAYPGDGEPDWKAEAERWRRIAGWVPLSVREGTTTPEQWVEQREGFVAALQAERDALIDGLDWAWAIIANAGGGNWERNESAEWREAAAKWRDEWMPKVAADAAQKARETRSTGAPAQNDAPANGTAPQNAPAPNAAVIVPLYSPHPEPCGGCDHPDCRSFP